VRRHGFIPRREPRRAAAAMARINHAIPTCID
jgi:hypothetical protein